MSIDLNTQGPKSIYQPPFRVATPYPYTGDDDRYMSSSSDIVLPWPEKYPPRPYLTEAVDRTIAAADAGKRGIVHLPTGTGKTLKAARVIQHYHALGKRSLFLHHRKELGAQTLGKFRDFGLSPGIEQSGCHAPKNSRDPVIASVLSLQGSRLRSWPPDAFDIILTDECHHAEAQSYQNIYNHFTGAQSHIGITATVDRYDRRSLLRTYPDGIIYSYSLLDAVLDGWLCHPKAVRIGIRPDLRRCKIVAGDFVASELGVAISSHLSIIAASIRYPFTDRTFCTAIS